MQVMSKPGTQCPMEGKPREYIGDAEPMSVPESSYYLRLIDDGSLIRINTLSAAAGSEAPQADANDLPAAGRQTVKALDTNVAHKGGKSR